MASRIIYRCVLGLAVGSVSGLAQVSDDFDDGNDDGWTRLNPLQAVGGSGTYSFPDGNSYRIQAGASPNPDVLGQARLGSLREDLSQTAFRVSLDIVATNAALEQDIGILTRVTDPGLGTLNGYSATIDTDESSVFLSRLDGETPTTIESQEMALDASKDYRMVFHGYEGQLLVEIFEFPDLTTPIGSVLGFDDFHAEGLTGVFASAGVGNGTVDVTYDNFHADDAPDTDQDGMPDPVENKIFGNLDQSGGEDFDGDGRSNAEEIEEGTDPKVPDSFIEVRKFTMNEELLKIEFVMREGRTYVLQKSTDLKVWGIDGSADFTNLGEGIGEYATERGEGATEYLRISEVGED